MSNKVVKSLSAFIGLVAKSSLHSIEYLQESLSSDHSELLPLD